MKIMDGKKVSNLLLEKMKIEVDNLKKEKITPGLAVILIGDDSASHLYVTMKEKTCKQIGLYSIVHRMPKSITEKDIISTIHMMNNNKNIHSILIQLPLPKHINENLIIEAIDPNKDVDGFHPCNTGKLVNGLDCFIPCTPLGVIHLMEYYNISIESKNIVIVGTSNIVGKPLASLLLNKNATVTSTNIYTKNLSSFTKNADILISAVGKVNLITEDMVKEGVIIIDIGTNRLPNGKLVGDVDFKNVSPKCSFITPVPGGVGPMTISMLISNSIKSVKNRIFNDK